MADIMEHPVVAYVRALAEQAERAAAVENPVLAAEVARRRDDLMRILGEMRAGTEMLHSGALEVSVLADESLRRALHDRIGILLSAHVALWQALPYLSVDRGATRVVRDEMVSVMRLIADGVEMCFFKMDIPLATTLQERLVALPDTVPATDDWRAILADV